MSENGKEIVEVDDQLLKTRLQELCRLYNVSLDLIERTTTRDELIDRILDEYIFRFEEIPGTDLVEEKQPAGKYEKEKIRSLVMFATQAVGLKEQADVHERLRHSNEELQRVTQELRQANQRLETLNRHYLNMLGFVSHEIRSPLISILGFAELLQEGMLGELTEEQQNAVSIIMRVSKELIAMVRNYLDLSKIECGELRLSPAPVELYSEVIDPVLAEMREQFARRNMRLVKKLDDQGQRLELIADRELLKIVFVNLLSNAVKYGKEGSDVILEARHDADEVRISITNEGTGVPESHLGEIFEKFTRAAAPETEASRGTGLGLFNTRWIVEAHGGRVWAESEYGKWFRVHVLLPKKVEARAPCTVDATNDNGNSTPPQGEMTPSQQPEIPST